MILIKVFILLTFGLLTFNGDNLLMAQDSYEVVRKFTKLKIENEDFNSILDSLLQKERQCKDYNKSLFWSVSFTQLKDEEYAITITMQREISETYKYLGYFKIDSVVFIVSGNQLHKDFFIECDAEQEFKSKNMKMPRVEDYSTWLYGYKDNTLFFREEYTLPCK